MLASDSHHINPEFSAKYKLVNDWAEIVARKQRRGKGGEDPVPDRLETLRDASRAAAIRGESQLAARYGLLSVLLRHRHQKSLTLGDRVVACRKCGMARTSTTSTTRIRKGRITATCHNCQNVLRHTLR